MFLLVSSHPGLINMVWVGLIIIAVGILLRIARQPYVIAYILAGVLIGEHGFGILTDRETIKIIGEFGLILLLFFIGMEISLPELVSKWEVPAFGTLFQLGGSVLAVAILGWLNDWNINRILVLGFILCLSSSAVVIKLLQDTGESTSGLGQNVISILLMQDILIVPMLVITNYLGGQAPSAGEVVLQVIGGLLLIAGIILILKKKHLKFPFEHLLEKDHELQVFVATIICFGFAALTGFLGLSAALGAFFAGMLIHSSKSTEWFHDSLHAFRVVFVAGFFISIGMLIDLNFLFEYWRIIAGMLVAVYLTNHLINATVLHYFGRSWRRSLYGGALLAQIGELSFVLASSAYFGNIITDFEYQLTVITISLTLLVSPFWITLTRKLTRYEPEEESPQTS